MKTLTAKDAKYGVGRLIALARAEPVGVAKHGSLVVVVVTVEEFERPKALDAPASASTMRWRHASTSCFCRCGRSNGDEVHLASSEVVR